MPLRCNNKVGRFNVITFYVRCSEFNVDRVDLVYLVCLGGVAEKKRERWKARKAKALYVYAWMLEMTNDSMT
jgi:hypothetical protein